MRRATIVFALLAALLSGCGNPELESVIYQRYEGVSECPTCLRDCYEAVERKRKAGVPDDAPLISDTRIHILPSPIVKIKTSKTDFDNVWKAQISVKCETHGTLVTEESEWSFKNKKLRFIK